MSNGPVLVSVAVADDPERWEAAGFVVSDGSCQVGEVRVDLGAEGEGIAAWGLRGVEPGLLDGLDTRVDDIRVTTTAGDHPNGTRSLDHLVVTSHDPLRTCAALEERGFEVRRTVEMGDRRYTFFRVGETILELVGPLQADGDRPARLYGLAFTVADLDATATHLGPLLGPVRDAIQPGRRIATLRRQAAAAGRLVRPSGHAARAAGQRRPFRRKVGFGRGLEVGRVAVPPSPVQTPDVAHHDLRVVVDGVHVRTVEELGGCPHAVD